MKKEMLINVLQPEECRIAIVEDNILEELYVERTSQESYVGNIYKGRIVNIEPSIQAAFVDFGIGRNGFLHVSDVDPAYYRHLEPRRERGGRGEDRRRERPQRTRAPESRAIPPPARAEAPPAPAGERVFGAGIFDDELSGSVGVAPDVSADADSLTNAEGVEEVSPVKGRRAAPEKSSTPSSGKALADEDVETTEPRKRRRGRRRRNGPKDKANESGAPEDTLINNELPGTADLPDSEIPATDADATDEDESGVAEGSRPPRLESAERRTEEDDPSFAGEVSPSSFLDDSAGSRAGRREDRLDESVAAADDDDSDEEVPDVHTSGREDPEDDGDSEDDEGAFDEEDEADEDEGLPGRRDRPRHRRKRIGRDGNGRPKPLIQDIFKRGQEVLIQVIKEGIGTKGPTLSTYISIAGRYLVLMPGLNRIGVSRKIADDEQRRRLRDILNELSPPKGVGFIIRTAGVDRTKKELQNDLAYLLRIWQVVARRVRKQKAPSPVYQESDMITRTIRDTFTSDIDTIWVDEPTAFAHAQEFLQGVMPRYASRLKLYTSSEPLFYKYKIEEEIVRIQQRRVPLPSGGSIVIEQTEALVAIDVNSGNFRADNNAEETAYQMNLHAAKEIARQLRLRDLGGVIINDFIDMRDEKHRRQVEKALRDAVKRDRARTKVLKISQFGIIEMTRQRIRPSLKRSIYQDCPHCLGSGHVKTVESMSIDVTRMLQLAAHKEPVCRVQVRVFAPVAEYLLNRKRREITQLEESGNMAVSITGLMAVAPETLDLVCYDKHNNEVKLLPPEPAPRYGRGPSGR